MEISHPKRILAVSSPDSGLLDLLKGLTNTTPTSTGDSSDSSIAGTTHLFPIKTSYYSATIPIWLDEISEPPTWASEFLGPEAREVLTVLGAFIVCFRKPVDQAGLAEIKALLESVGQVVKEGCGYSWDGVCLAVGMPQSQTPSVEMSDQEWEDLCQDYGFEFVDFQAKGRNEFSEPMGLERLKEALEANDWGGGEEYNGEIDFDNLEDDDDEDDDNGSLDFGISREEMKDEMAGMKRAIYGGGEEEEPDATEEDEEEVEKLQAMMMKMQAVRDMGADMPESERRKFAAKAVNEIMKTL